VKDEPIRWKRPGRNGDDSMYNWCCLMAEPASRRATPLMM
jgi:hypothetical protein